LLNIYQLSILKQLVNHHSCYTIVAKKMGFNPKNSVKVSLFVNRLINIYFSPTCVVKRIFCSNVVLVTLNTEVHTYV